eukprot:12415017-Karenia_brevis.AAC.1
MAVVDVLERDPRPLNMRSDSKYVVEGIKQLALSPCWDIVANGDLWQRAYVSLRARTSNAAVKVTK